MKATYPLSSKIQGDLQEVEFALKQVAVSSSPLLTQTSYQTLEAGGKRLRPALVLISGQVNEYNLRALTKAAVAVELVHMASLVHDDVIDRATTRRGQPTVNSLQGKDAAVTTGDFLFAKAFVYLSASEEPRVMKIMAEAALALSVGELQQKEFSWDFSQGIDNYLERIKNKTASLFSACCQLGALISGGNEAEINLMKRYGIVLGTAFQIYDDLLDFLGEENLLGKAVGADLREGVITMPLLFALEDDKNFLAAEGIKDDVGNGCLEEKKLRKVITKVKNNKRATERTKKVARKYVDEALDIASSLSSLQLSQDLRKIGEFVIDRYH